MISIAVQETYSIDMTIGHVKGKQPRRRRDHGGANGRGHAEETGDGRDTVQANRQPWSRVGRARRREAENKVQKCGRNKTADAQIRDHIEDLSDSGRKGVRKTAQHGRDADHQIDPHEGGHGRVPAAAPPDQQTKNKKRKGREPIQNQVQERDALVRADHHAEDGIAPLKREMDAVTLLNPLRSARVHRPDVPKSGRQSNG